MIIELLTVSIEPKVGLFSNIKDRRPVKIVATDHAGFLKMSKLYNIIIGIINITYSFRSLLIFYQNCSVIYHVSGW